MEGDSDSAVNGGDGGGIFNSHDLEVLDSVISLNGSGSNTGTGSAGEGGGIFNITGGTLTIEDTTITNNYTGYSSGSGLSDGSGLVNWGGSATFGNSILADNFANSSLDCSGEFVSTGYNLVEDDSGCTITGDTLTNIYDQDPRLAPLEVVGGMNYMHRLMLGTPAIDAGSNTCIYIDQRHLLRPKDGDGDGNVVCDIGAYEAYLWIFSPVIINP